MPSFLLSVFSTLSLLLLIQPHHTVSDTVMIGQTVPVPSFAQNPPDLSQTLGQQISTDAHIIGHKIVTFPATVWHGIVNLPYTIPYYTGRLVRKIKDGIGHMGDAGFAVAAGVGHGAVSIGQGVDHVQDKMASGFRDFVDRHVDEENRPVIYQNGQAFAKINEADENVLDKQKSNQQLQDIEEELDDLIDEIEIWRNSQNNIQTTVSTSSPSSASSLSALSDEAASAISIAKESARSRHSKSHSASHHPRKSAQYVQDESDDNADDGSGTYDTHQQQQQPSGQHPFTLIGFLGKGIMGTGKIARQGVATTYRGGKVVARGADHVVHHVGNHMNEEFGAGAELTGQMVRGVVKNSYRGARAVGRDTVNVAVHGVRTGGSALQKLGKSGSRVFDSKARKRARGELVDGDEDEQGGDDEEQNGDNDDEEQGDDSPKRRR